MNQESCRGNGFMKGPDQRWIERVCVQEVINASRRSIGINCLNVVK